MGGNYGGAPPGVQRTKGRATATDTSLTPLIAAPGTGFKNWISGVTVCNSHATSGTIVQLKSAATTIWSIPAPPGKGGAILTFPDPIDCGENEALNFSCDDAVSTITVSVAGYKAPV